MNQQRSPWRRWLFGIAATTGLVAYALGAALTAQSAPEPPPQDEVYQITLTFLHNDSSLTDDDREKIDVLAEKMKNKTGVEAFIFGYAAPDEVSPGHTPQDLAVVRAEKVYHYLINHQGIESRLVRREVGKACSPENDEETKCQKAVITVEVNEE